MLVCTSTTAHCLPHSTAPRNTLRCTDQRGIEGTSTADRCMYVFVARAPLKKRPAHITSESVRYSYGCRTKFTKVSGTVQLVVNGPVPAPRYLNKIVPGTRVFCHGRTKLAKALGTNVEVVRSISKYRVQVWMSYQAYQSVWCGTACCTHTCRYTLVFGQDRTLYQGILTRTYQTYHFESVGRGNGSRTKLTRVSGTGSTRGCKVSLVHFGTYLT